MRMFIQFIILFLNPRYSKALYINGNETDAKAFSKSMRTKRPDIFSFSVKLDHKYF